MKRWLLGMGIWGIGLSFWLSPHIAHATTPDYGGGFLELLIKGHVESPTPPPSYDPSTFYANPTPDIDPIYQRQIVAYQGPEKPGTILVDTRHRFLFLIQEHQRAIRYGIGVGRPGFEWHGVKFVSHKTPWPDWTPPPEMLKRRPDLPHFMRGGPANPLGARALYLGSSLYRIHGTNEPETIGTHISSGCIRMRNEDVIDLYNRVKVGTKVIVL